MGGPKLVLKKMIFKVCIKESIPYKQYSFKELPPREKSQRIQKIAEKERLRLSTDNAFNRKGGLMNSPSWFGSTVPANPKEDELFKSTPVPKFDLGVQQVLELTRDIIQLLIFCT